MKLIHEKITYGFEFNDEYFNVLTIENSKFFRGLIQELVNQTQGKEGSFVLSHNYKELDIKKNVELIINPFILEFNQKKIIDHIYNELREIAYDEERYLITSNIMSQVEKLIIDLIDCTDYPLLLQNVFDFNLILKSFKVQVMDLEQELVERLVSYMELLTQLNPKRVFVLVNIYDYMKDDEIDALLYDLNIKNIKVMLVQRYKSDRKHNYEKNILIDEDLCEIY